MPNIFQMMKQAGSIKQEMKRMQKDLEKDVVEFSCPGGGVTVRVRGDMTLQDIRIAPELLVPAQAGHLQEKVLTSVNGALNAAREKAAARMTSLTSGLGLGDLMGS